MEFNDDLLDDTAQAMDLVERSETWSRVNKLFRNLENDDQCALQMVVIDEMGLRQTARLLGISVMTVQRLSLIHISEPTRLGMISYAVFCLKKKK